MIPYKAPSNTVPSIGLSELRLDIPKRIGGGMSKIGGGMSKIGGGMSHYSRIIAYIWT